MPDPPAVPSGEVIAGLPSPCFLVDLDRLEANGRLLDAVRRRAGCEILLALKGFAMFSTFPRLRPFLGGTCASSVHEARLGREEFGGELHAYAPAYTDEDIGELLPLIDHITFNSVGQWGRHAQRVLAAGRPIAAGMRVNPGHSEAEVPIYDPCAPGSRLGERAERMDLDRLPGLSGLHMHTLCEQNSDALERTVEALERRCGHLLADPRVRWLNLGGGHHITRSDYDIGRLCRVVSDLRERHDLRIYLEPGEAVALDAGYLVTTVLDVIDSDGPIAILDASATAHMPDVLEMPYRPDLVGALPDDAADGCRVRLGGLTCLAGDLVGEYTLPRVPAPGDRMVFTDMAHYTMVKTTGFNGVRMPSQALYRSSTGALDLEIIRRFGYHDYRSRLS